MRACWAFGGVELCLALVLLKNKVHELPLICNTLFRKQRARLEFAELLASSSSSSSCSPPKQLQSERNSRHSFLLSRLSKSQCWWCVLVAVMHSQLVVVISLSRAHFSSSRLGAWDSNGLVLCQFDDTMFAGCCERDTEWSERKKLEITGAPPPSAASAIEQQQWQEWRMSAASLSCSLFRYFHRTQTHIRRLHTLCLPARMRANNGRLKNATKKRRPKENGGNRREESEFERERAAAATVSNSQTH